jgi:hypothetical protein
MLEPASPWVADANADGIVTIADIVPWCLQAYFLPGDWAIWALGTYLPSAAEFLQLSEGSYGGTVSALVSAAAWLALLLGGLIAYHRLRELDRRVTSALAEAYRDSLRRVRVARATLAYRLGSRARRPAASEPLDYVVEHELDADQLALLRAHAEVEPPYALTLGEAASALSVPKHRAQPIVEKLIALRLLERGSGGYGEPASVISRAGRALLMFRQLERTNPAPGAGRG